MAQFGLIAFFSLFTLSASIIFHGSVGTGFDSPLALGDRLPGIKLPDLSGNLVDLGHGSEPMQMIVYASPASLSAAERQVVEALVRDLGNGAALKVVAITDRSGGDSQDWLPSATHLLDETRSVRRLLGHNVEPLVCLVDRDRTLCFRSELGDAQPLPEVAGIAPVQASSPLYATVANVPAPRR
jgi:hypothetical protein